MGDRVRLLPTEHIVTDITSAGRLVVDDNGFNGYVRPEHVELIAPPLAVNDVLEDWTGLPVGSIVRDYAGDPFIINDDGDPIGVSHRPGENETWDADTITYPITVLWLGGGS